MVDIREESDLDQSSQGGSSLMLASRTIRRQRIVIVVAVLCALVAVGGLFASRWVKSPREVASETGPPVPSRLTAQVDERVLSESLIFRGTVASGSQVEITPPASGASDATSQVVTAIRTNIGATVRAGESIVEVSGRPLIVLPGAVPSYRDLKPGDTGNDVRELQSALAGFGDFHDALDGQFGASTKVAVSKLYSALGYDTPTTGGPDDAGDRDALQGAQSAVGAAQRAVDDMNRQIEAAQATPSPSASGPKGPSGDEPLTLQLKYLQQSLLQAITDQQYVVAHTGPMVPAAELAFVANLPAIVSGSTAKVGSVVQSPLITLDTGHLVVTDKMDPDQAKFLARAMPATIESELLGATATGSVSGIGVVTVDPPAAASPTQTGSGTAADTTTTTPYVLVTVTPTKPLPASWNGQDVRLTVTSAKTRGPVLSVPVAAITTRADGQTIVTTVKADGATADVVVDAGVSADGFVAVTPRQSSLVKGDQVVVGR